MLDWDFCPRHFSLLLANKRACSGSKAVNTMHWETNVEQTLGFSFFVLSSRIWELKTMQDTENCIPLSKNENSCPEFTWCFLQAMCCWFVASVQKDELAVRRVYFLCAAAPSSSGQRETSVENFALPVTSKLAYAVPLRDGALTAVLLFSSWAAEMGFGKWLKSDWVLCFQIAGAVPWGW